MVFSNDIVFIHVIIIQISLADVDIMHVSIMYSNSTVGIMIYRISSWEWDNFSLPVYVSLIYLEKNLHFDDFVFFISHCSYAGCSSPRHVFLFG